MTDLLPKLFVKNYQNTGDPRVRKSYGTLVSITGILLNILLFVAKFTVGTLFGAVSIVADAINNLSDAGSQMISLISFRISAKPADREHPFGHARIEYIASMIVSFLILYIGIDLLKESVTKIFHPELPERSWLAAAVLMGSILVKLWLGFFNRRIGKKIDSAVMRATAADSLSDVLSTGAVLVATLVMLLWQELDWNLDAYMGVIVAVFILISGVKIFLEAKNSILGEAPPDEIVRDIRRTVSKYPQALGIHDLEVHNYGPGHVIAALHIEVDGKENIFDTHDIIDNIERDLRENCGIEATIHMDPIVTDDEEVTALRAETRALVKEIDERLDIHDFRFVRGTTHTNQIFDITVPFEVKITDDDIRREVTARVRRVHPDHFLVLTLDRT